MANQLAWSGSDPWLVATLPADVRPTRYVYTIAHTLRGRLRRPVDRDRRHDIDKIAL